ncbi:methyltransferase [Candidatus Epulonipiscium fishelsonii]|uniref:Methyltransferase n=1 Tax=Candidatus Epulonipiscium fishelsonii TaxID=77094 RepID=A0ACC8XIX6_9FIRM|nr:methyltransferase [Epulopiscium sp. SCG-D08WGA-EpuloA1]
MEDTPYDNWENFILSKLKENNIEPKIICDLGCGIGSMCERFAKNNIEVIGIDNSFEMLMQARERALEKELDILYLQQDMISFELYGTVDLIYSSCDSLNYILEEDDLLKVFRLVNNYLEAGGLFIFDMNTPYKYKEILGEQVFAEQTDTEAYIWENFYDEEAATNEFYVSFFIQDRDKRYTRTEEFHYQRAYTINQIRRLLEVAGLEIINVYDNYTSEYYNDTTTRATFVAKEKPSPNKKYTRRDK